MNIIMLVIDTLRYDYIGAHGNEWIRTPNMDRLASESWVFEGSFAASFPTIPHRTDVLTGRYGAPFNPWRPLRFDVPTFPSILAEDGYCTQLICDTPHLINGGHNFDWPFHAWTFIRGAEVDRPWITDDPAWPATWAHDPLFDCLPEVAWHKRGGISYVRANQKRTADEEWNCAKLFRAASQFLRDNARRDKFFLWVDCFDPHEPWDTPPEFVKMYDKTPGYDGRIDPRTFTWKYEGLSEEGEKRIIAFYSAKVTWMDRWLGEFLDALDETGLSKNTAVILTSDHGTALGERGRFHKGVPVCEWEAHVPMMVRLPEGDTGRSKIIVQPQDLFATVLGLAGSETPGELDAHDIVSVAREGGEGPRTIALSGGPASQWGRDPDGVLFSAFDGEWCLHVTAKGEDCKLMRMGEAEDVAADHGDVVQRLRKAAVDEIARRGTDSSLVRWLRKEGKGKFPRNARMDDGSPTPEGYYQYWNKLYEGQ